MQRPPLTLPFDSFGSLEKWKARQLFESEKDTQEAAYLDPVKEDIERAVALLVGRFPFFGAFVYNFRILYVHPKDPHIQTMATDGKNIFINPAFAASLTDAQTVFVLCHEILHNVMVHFAREKAHNIPRASHGRWNEAADYEINPMLVEEGLLTADEVKNKLMGLYEEKYLEMTAEEIYDLLPPAPPKKSMPDWLKKAIQDAQKKMSEAGNPPPSGSGSGSPGEGEPGGEGGEPGEGSGGEPGDAAYGIGGLISEEASVEKQKELGVPVERATKEEVDKIIEQAMKEIADRADKADNPSATRGRGSVGKLLSAAVKRLGKPQVDWKAELRRYIGKMLAKNEDYLGKRKHLHRGDYFYGDRPVDNRLKDAIMPVDLSGSMGKDERDTILTEVVYIIRAKKIHKTELVYFDDGITGIDMVKYPPVFNYDVIKGGGGTSFIQPFEHVAKRFKAGKAELCVFCTDGYGDQDQLPKNPPFKHKWIWLVTDNSGFQPPFGKVIHIKTKRGKS